MMTAPCALWVMRMTESTGDSASWLLHRRPYRNSSLIVEFLSAKHGRVAAVARAGRRNTALQPFRPLAIDLRGRNELRSLTLCEPAGVPVSLTGDQLYCGMYMNELLVRLLQRDDPHPELPALYQATLQALASDSLPMDVSLRWFEMNLMDALGYGLSLRQDNTGHAIVAQQQYDYVSGEGLVAQPNGRFAGQWLLALADNDWQEPVRRLARDLMREALAPHLGDRPLLSRQLFRPKSRQT